MFHFIQKLSCRKLYNFRRLIFVTFWVPIQGMLNPQVLRVQKILIFKRLFMSIANHTTMEPYYGVEVLLHTFLTWNWLTWQRIRKLTYVSTSSAPKHWMEVNGWLQFLAAAVYSEPPGKSPALTGRDVMWPIQPMSSHFASILGMLLNNALNC
jgi:hypothetical protein